MKTDIEIARNTPLVNIEQIAKEAGIPADSVIPYGRHMAKVDEHLIDEEKAKKSNLILVTAITPTKAGIGKTTVSIGLTLGLNKIGKKAIVALREPSLGPCFGMKGGAAGGGYTQVLPMEKINLHFTGDFHAITSANNMIAALLDNYMYQNRDRVSVSRRYCGAAYLTSMTARCATSLPVSAPRPMALPKKQVSTSLPRQRLWPSSAWQRMRQTSAAA